MVNRTNLPPTYDKCKTETGFLLPSLCFFSKYSIGHRQFPPEILYNAVLILEDIRDSYLRLLPLLLRRIAVLHSQARRMG